MIDTNRFLFKHFIIQLRFCVFFVYANLVEREKIWRVCLIFFIIFNPIELIMLNE